MKRMFFLFPEQQLPLQLKIELRIKARELDNVTLEPSVEEGWDKWGKMFTDNFIGTTDNAASVKSGIRMISGFAIIKSNRVIAYSDKPVVIENNALDMSSVTS